MALALTALKLWLTRGLGVYAIGGPVPGDQVFLELAQHLVQGEWLGTDAGAALAHGPFYPMFIAGALVLGLPLFLAQQLLYAAACALLVLALWPAISSAGARAALFALLLWNPMTFEGSAMSRVMAEQVGGPLVLLVFAGLAALCLRRAEPPPRQRPWLLLAGFAGGAYYLTGLPVVWLAPGVAVLAGFFLLDSRQTSRAAGQAAARILTLALVAAVLPPLLVCARNQYHYGRFVTHAPASASATEPPAGFLSRCGQSADFLVSFSRFSGRAPPSTGAQEQLQLFRNVTHERLSPPAGELDTVGATRYLNNLWKTDTLHRVGKALRPVLLGAFALAQLVALARVVHAVRIRRWSDLLVVVVAAWISCTAAVVVHAASWAENFIADFAPVYPLLLVFVGVTLWDAFAAWRPERAT